MTTYPKTNKIILSKFIYFFSLFVLITPVVSLSAQNFVASNLSGANPINPTTLQFGPDNRLYVAQLDGLIYAYTIKKQDINEYTIIETETIDIIQKIKNHDDNGEENDLDTRQITGILVTGTEDKIIIYVGSSDPRIGGGSIKGDVNLDTNSGIISKLTKSNGTWERIDLVRGLPRSEENHANNGMYIKDHLLYVAQGGNTNAGAPSNNFAFLTEYALSAAILTVDLQQIEAMPTKVTHDGSLYKYDLPTLDDPFRENQNGTDLNDPFGGNDGFNQAKIVPDGPVQVYASGFRNIYDVLWTEDNKLYTWDNGANQGWGGHPDNEGYGTATNNWIQGEPGSSKAGPNDNKVNNLDGLHLVSSDNYYGGHPNPIRANPNGAGLFYHNAGLDTGGEAGLWLTSKDGDSPLPIDWPPVPSSLANPIEGDYQNPGIDDLSLYTIESSTNGLAEYTASYFNNSMKGNILAVSFDGALFRVQRNAEGKINNEGDVTVLADNFGSFPLDITTQNDNSPFPGTIWVANFGSNDITILEPLEIPYCEQSRLAPEEDDDNDLYSNLDEFMNNSDPCNAASMPADFDKTLIDGFLVSNLNDPDDDDDGIDDNTDPFVWDKYNGTTTNIPINYPLLNADPGRGFYGLGFTGLMTNETTDYLDLINNEENSATEIIAGGAVGLLTFNNISTGDPYTSNNTQHNGFQFGINVNQLTNPFVYEGQLLGPLFTDSPQKYQSAGIFIGKGDQASYLKVVVGVNRNNATGIQILYEDDDEIISNEFIILEDIGIETVIRLLIKVIPQDGTVQAQYAINNKEPQHIGQAIKLQGELLNTLQSDLALATGVISTSIGSNTAFNATYEHLSVYFIEPNLNNLGQWTYINDGEYCSDFGLSGSCPQGRHENSYVQVGDKFYLLGGRENNSNVNIYDPLTNSWTIGSTPPFPVHHTQAVVYDNLIYFIGSFMDNSFPNEKPNPKIIIYHPLLDKWIEGTTIPADRLRGSVGAVVYNDKIYIVNGITNGHSDGWVNWFDAFDPRTNEWSILPNAPQARDHFQAAILNNKLYVAGGRRSGQQTTFLPTIGEVDVFDFQINQWGTMDSNLPTERASPTTAVFQNELLVIGGEQSSGLASNQVESLDVENGTWRVLSPLQEGRHGTQAIINNNGVYIASGSPVVGGGTTKTQEVFTFDNEAIPTVEAIFPSILTTETNTLNFDKYNTSQEIILTNTEGTQGIIIESISINNNNYSIEMPTSLPIHLSPGHSLNITLKHIENTTTDGELLIQHTGQNGPSTTINLQYCDFENNAVEYENTNDLPSITNSSEHIIAGNLSGLGDVIIEDNRSISFKAKNYIQLLPGFHAKSGSNFHAEIEDCIKPLNTIKSDSIATRQLEYSHDDNSPTDLDLNINIHPNPFSSKFILNFILPISEKVNIYVTNLLGQKQILVANKMLNAGNHSFTYHGDNLSENIYIITIQIEGNIFSKKIIRL